MDRRIRPERPAPEAVEASLRDTDATVAVARRPLHLDGLSTWYLRDCRAGDLRSADQRPGRRVRVAHEAPSPRRGCSHRPCRSSPSRSREPGRGGRPRRPRQRPPHAPADGRTGTHRRGPERSMAVAQAAVDPPDPAQRRAQDAPAAGHVCIAAGPRLAIDDELLQLIAPHQRVAGRHRHRRRVGARRAAGSSLLPKIGRASGPRSRRSYFAARSGDVVFEADGSAAGGATLAPTRSIQATPRPGTAVADRDGPSWSSIPADPERARKATPGAGTAV